jgi:hypothetical protein
MLQPVDGRRDDAHVLGEMLQGEGFDGDSGLVGIDEDRAKEAHSFPDSFAVVIDGAVREMGEAAFAGVEPVVQREVIGGTAAMFALGGKRVVVGMHGENPPC